MNCKYNAISFCSRDYVDMTTRKVDNEALFGDMAELLRILMANNYQCKLWFDSMTYVVEFNERTDLSGVTLEWVGEDEYVESYKPFTDEDEETKE